MKPNITITKVLKNDVTICGQTLSREYVENIMLPMLVAQCATVRAYQYEVAKVFDEAGLSLSAIPDVAQGYFQEKRIKDAHQARLQAEADAHAERCREWTPRDLAEAKAKREAQDAAIREHGNRIRSASRNSGW